MTDHPIILAAAVMCYLLLVILLGGIFRGAGVAERKIEQLLRRKNGGA